MLLPGYRIFVRYYDGRVVTKHFRCNSKYDLFAYIGFLYSTSLNKIDRIDYKHIVADTEWDLMARDLKKVYESED